jgi:hypothetical protein
MGRTPIGSQAMSPAERQRRHRGHIGLCKYCGKPGQRLAGIGYVDENEVPRQIYVCRRCIIEALGLLKQMAEAARQH